MSTDDVYQTKAWNKLVYFFGDDIIAEQLRSLASVVDSYLKIGLTGEQKRTKANLIKWFDANYDVVFPWMQTHLYIKLRDGTKIDLKDKKE